MPDQPPSLTLYPIQATFITVREIHFVSHRPPSPTDKIEQSTISITQSATPFNEVTRRVQVTLAAEFGPGNEPSPNPPPFTVKVAMTGEFVIDPSFPADKINLWVAVNAAFVIYPYLRERLYYITSQGGYPPILLPLMQIPTIKIAAPQPQPVPTAAAK
jgi:preprotein translocase subunit SecB